MSASLCGLCRGARNFFCVQAGTCEWHECPACGGAGVRALFGPAEIRGDRERFWWPPAKEAAR